MVRASVPVGQGNLLSHPSLYFERRSSLWQQPGAAAWDSLGQQPGAAGLGDLGLRSRSGVICDLQFIQVGHSYLNNT